MPDAMAWWTACSTDNLIANGIPAISSNRSELMLVALEDAVDAGVPSHRKAKRRRIVKSWRSAAPAASHSTATTSAAAAGAGVATAPPATIAAHPEKDPTETPGSASVPPEDRSPTDDQEMESSGTGQNGTVSREGAAQAVGANGRGPEAAAGSATAATLAPAPAPAQPVIGVREVRGMRAKVEGNIATIMHLRKIHRKFGALATASEIEAPLPTWLKTTSSDEESDDPPSADEDSADEDAPNTFRSSTTGSFSIPPPPEGHTYEAPFSKLTATASRSNMRTHVQTLLAHVGFEGSHAAPVDVLTHVASDFLLSMGRTLRLYADRCAQQMSAEEMILHSIRENGAGDVPSLEAYVKDDVERYGIKLTQLLGKLRQSYKDQLNSADRGVIQDDALFADDGAAFQSGFFMDELGDDYLGFKALGLDQELGVSGLSIPSRLFHGRSMGNRAAPQGSASAKENVPFPPPPTFIPLSSGGITLQIGLLQDWYRQRLRERKEEARLGREDGDPAADPADDEDDEDGDDDDEQVRGILADEEPEKTRIKVPPTGRIPRRTMWDPAAKDAPAPTLVHADGPGAKGLSELSGKDVSNAKDGGADGEGGMGTNGKKRKGEIGGGDGEATPGKGAKKKKKKILIAVA
ncbi:unnamed protein product [Tilletia controversa]|nr:unnamed protein product [Tilletia controversa]